ncbi:MAG TPA: transporter substrate-binding domain-containing protein [Limnobacter sp.]|nr:transporter substrate-binding domain-containing protein [Limnobacter sp.]
MNFLTSRKLFKPAFRLACASVLTLAVSGAALAQDLTDWARVKASGVLTVAVYNYLAPYSDQGKGIDVDIAKALATKLGLGLKVRPFTEDEEFSDDIRNMVVRGHYLAGPPADILMHAPVDAYIMQKEDQALFFSPYTRDDIFVARNIKALPTLDSLKPFSEPGNRIGAETAALPSIVLAGADNAAYANNLVNFKTPKEAVDAMVKGELVAVMATRAELEWALHQYPDKKADYFVSKVPHNSLPPKGWAVGMATKKTNKELAEKLTAAMNELKDSGELEKIFASYGVKYMRP